MKGGRECGRMVHREEETQHVHHFEARLVESDKRVRCYLAISIDERMDLGPVTNEHCC